jgi:uncharacterized protein YyaL (SSP411 family)
LDRANREESNAAYTMLLTSLVRMAAGGIRDHLGGGFHRYSTDRYWRIPHFEKMLYDNAQLACVYAKAYRLTQREDFKQVAEEILGFVEREMTAPGGAFYTALDAETEGEEGHYYTWEIDEVEELLTPSEAKLVGEVYGVQGISHLGDRFVLMLTAPLEEHAERRDVGVEELEASLRPIREKLLAARRQRMPPRTDTKILTSCNGLMIRGFADAGRLFSEPRYTQIAARAADFILTHLRDADGRLLRSYAEGQARLHAYLDDYAYLIDGLIALHEASGEPRWLEQADGLMADQLKWYWDQQGAGFFYTPSDHEELIARIKSHVDRAEPSPNAISAQNLVYLSRQLEKPDYRARAEETIRDAAPMLDQSPAALPRTVMALSALLRSSEKQP